MGKVKQSLLGFWVLGIIVLAKIVFLFLAYLSVRRIQQSYGSRFKINYFSTVDLVILLILLGEMMVYWALRHKIRDIRWVRWHVWTLFFFMVVYPLIFIALITYMGSQLNRVNYYNFLKQSGQIRFVLFWFIVSGAHVFLLLLL